MEMKVTGLSAVCWVLFKTSNTVAPKNTLLSVQGKFTFSSAILVAFMVLGWLCSHHCLSPYYAWKWKEWGDKLWRQEGVPGGGSVVRTLWCLQPFWLPPETMTQCWAMLHVAEPRKEWNGSFLGPGFWQLLDSSTARDTEKTLGSLLFCQHISTGWGQRRRVLSSGKGPDGILRKVRCCSSAMMSHFSISTLCPYFHQLSCPTLHPRYLLGEMLPTSVLTTFLLLFFFDSFIMLY